MHSLPQGERMIGLPVYCKEKAATDGVNKYAPKHD